MGSHWGHSATLTRGTWRPGSCLLAALDKSLPPPLAEGVQKRPEATPAVVTGILKGWGAWEGLKCEAPLA